MTPREKVLGIGVGGVLVLVGLQFVWSKYRTAVDSRESQIAALDQQIMQANDRLIQGAYADRMMGEYFARSLPGDPEIAVANYNRWLFELITLVDLSEAKVQFLNSTAVEAANSDPRASLYRNHGFKVTGKTDQRGWVELLYLFHAKDYLHRITAWSATPRQEGGMAIDLTIEAIGLDAASPDLKSPQQVSPLVGDFDKYADTILNRNFFSPPNQPPRFTAPTQLTVSRGDSAPLALAAEDPEKGRLLYSIVDEAPAGMEIDPRSGELRWRPSEVGEYRLTVRVADDGYPSASTEQTFQIAVVDPPTPTAPPARVGFDDSTQTVLTALVQGGGDWTAWMKVRTQGTTLKLRPGDPFEIGSLVGTVVDVNARFVTLEIDGKRFELRPAGNLAEAARTAVGD